MADTRNTERRRHTKSRQGCLSCKKRHVKCNEVHPECNNCLRLGIRCVWPQHATKVNYDPSPKNSVAPTVVSFNDSPPSQNGSSAAATLTATLGIPDLRLLHFWMQNTSGTCTFGGSASLWQTALPELGFRHPFLLRGILAVAAIHKAVIFPEESADLRLQSDVHMDAALTVFREHLKYPDIATAVPVFAMSSFVAMHMLGSALVTPPDDAIVTAVVWMRLSKGTKTACEGYWSRILGSEMSTIIRGARRSSEKKDSEVDIIRLRERILEIVPPEDASLHSYLEAVDALHVIASNVRYPLEADQLPVNITMSWPTYLSYDMLALIEQKDAIATIIVAHFAVLLSLLEDKSWYLRKWGIRILESAEGVLSGTIYESWLDWPRSMLRSNVHLF